MDELLYMFAGEEAHFDDARLSALVVQLVGTEGVGQAIDQLVGLSFLGVQTAPSRFEYAEDPRDQRRLRALGRGHTRRTGETQSYEIHPAFRTYLGINASNGGQGSLAFVTGD